MRIAYIIHAYKLPVQLAKLVTSLASPDTYFFVHIDKKIDIEPFKEAFAEAKLKNVIWVEREYSNWGTVNCVKAILNALSIALKQDASIEYFYCLSGQDYPIKPRKNIENFFEKNKAMCFVRYFPLPNPGWKGGGAHRYNRFHFIISKNRYIRRLMNIINFFLPRRKIPYNLKPFGGEFYLGLNRKSTEYIIQFIEIHPLYLPFFKYSYIPEEIFFQTILLNGPKEIYANINNRILTYVDWNKPKGPYPANLNASDLSKLAEVDYLFGRKFDTNIDSNILDLIDEKLLK